MFYSSGNCYVYPLADLYYEQLIAYAARSFGPLSVGFRWRPSARVIRRRTLALFLHRPTDGWHYRDGHRTTSVHWYRKHVLSLLQNNCSSKRLRLDFYPTWECFMPSTVNMRELIFRTSALFIGTILVCFVNYSEAKCLQEIPGELIWISCQTSLFSLWLKFSPVFTSLLHHVNALWYSCSISTCRPIIPLMFNYKFKKDIDLWLCLSL